MIIYIKALVVLAWLFVSPSACGEQHNCHVKGVLVRLQVGAARNTSLRFELFTSSTPPYVIQR